MSSEVQELIRDILDSSKDTNNALSSLEDAAKTDGVSLQDFSTLMDIAFEPTTSSMVRNRILDKCLVPDGRFLVPPEVLLRVLGSIGAPEIYYNKGKQHKSKHFSLRTQQRILQWTVNILPFFGLSVYCILRKSLPILFGLLSYEYSRPHIATLIIVATSVPQGIEGVAFRKLDQKQTNSSLLRSWHAGLVADLLTRFPLDASLKAIAMHISRSELPAGIRSRLRQKQNFGSSSLAGGIAFPDDDFPAISRLVSESSSDTIGQEVLNLHRQFSYVYREFERTAKRRKIGGFAASQKSDIINATSVESSVPISSINSVQTLISEFEKINFINPSSIFGKVDSHSQRFRCLYVSLTLIGSGKSGAIYKKISSALQHHVLPDTLLPVTRGKYSLKMASRFGTLGLFNEDVDGFLSALCTSMESSISVLTCSLQLVPYAHLAKTETILQFTDLIFTSVKILLERKDTKTENLIPLLMLELSSFVWRLDNTSNTDTFGKFLAKVYEHIDKLWSDVSLVCKLSFAAFMVHTINYASQKFISWIDPVCLIPPPSLIFRLVTSMHPLIASEGLGLIASMKKLNLSENVGLRSRLKNAYVMDSINFLWRDMAFKFEKGTFNHGMCLHPTFLLKINGLDFFSNSDLVSVKSVGGIVQNPAFAYLCAEILWKLEDQEDGISTRHPGPITEASVTILQQDNGARWLKLNYQDLKISLLNHLDTLGFDGLADLLFTSLKPLVDKRAKPASVGN